jgi:hypothetical protein
MLAFDMKLQRSFISPLESSGRAFTRAQHRQGLAKVIHPGWVDPVPKTRTLSYFLRGVP